MLQEVLPSVVNISARGKAKTENPLADSPLFNDPQFRRFFGVPDMPEYREAQSLGSGVIIDAGHGYVITNAHVVKGAEEITVGLANEKEAKASVVGIDEETDLAVLQIKGEEKLKALPISDSDKLRVGDYVVAIGNPFGLHQTVTSGIVSALGRSGIGEADRFEDYIQTDASINPGNSGGALVNLRGELVGINSAILSQSGGNIGIGFAIPVNIVKQVMSQIIQYGKVDRGRLGVIVQNLTPELSKALGLTVNKGVVVTKVQPGSAAEQAGIKTEDVIVSINGKKVDSYRELRNTIGLLRIDDALSLEVIRNGTRQTFQTKVGQTPAEEEVAITPQNESSLDPRLAGAVFAEADGKGMQVRDLQPGSPAAYAGLRRGDIITAINRRPVHTTEEFRKLVKGVGDGNLLLTIQRGQGVMYLLLH
jgi:serine protease Do/serine protease DegQ